MSLSMLLEENAGITIVFNVIRDVYNTELQSVYISLFAFVDQGRNA